jgi:hypothetical protein
MASLTKGFFEIFVLIIKKIEKWLSRGDNTGQKKMSCFEGRNERILLKAYDTSEWSKRGKL